MLIRKQTRVEEYNFFAKIFSPSRLYAKNIIPFEFLEQPSSSSLSTTTSSVTSMTSLEHESNDTSVSASDYGNDNWDNENWGDMDVSIFISAIGNKRKLSTFHFNFYRHHKIQVAHSLQLPRRAYPCHQRRQMFRHIEIRTFVMAGTTTNGEVLKKNP